VILKPGDSDCTVLQKLFFRKKPGGGEVEINGGPAIVNGRIFVCTSDEAVCFGKKGHSETRRDPSRPEGGAGRQDPKPLTCGGARGCLTAPGGSAEFKARLFDDKGGFCETKATVAGCDVAASPARRHAHLDPTHFQGVRSPTMC
jgi:hypothetical protein